MACCAPRRGALPWFSVGHRSTLRNFHDHLLDVATFSPPREQLPAMSNSDLDLA
jgi:hypothetical protein